jgi:uncharacterized protein YndB with AHSA1/START domain
MSDDQPKTFANPARVTTSGEREVTIEREFAAPRERVFAAFVDAEQIVQWWGRRESTTIVDKMEARDGGDWRFVERNPDGSENAFRGSYREVNEPERIVYTFEWEGMPGYVCLEQVDFEAHGERTRIVTKTTFFAQGERDGMLESGMEIGLNESYEMLDELLTRV